jgi:hypothetical protein
MRFTSLIFAVLLTGVFMVQKTTPPPTTHTPIPGSNWVNVRDYGALGNGGDDAPGFVAAIKAAASQWGGGTVYCPAVSNTYNAYWFPNGITLPYAGNRWIEIYLDCNIGLGRTMVVPSRYYIHGHNAGQGGQFDTLAVSQIYANQGVSPALKLGSSVRLENLSVTTGSGDAIYSGNSVAIRMVNVGAGTRDRGATGSPLHIQGGWDIAVEEGGFVPSANQPSILIEDDPAQCVGVGIMQFDRVFIANHGVHIKANCGYLQTIRLTQFLYESGQDALVNFRGSWPGMITGIKVEDCAIADSSAAVVNNAAPRVYGVKIDGCPVTGGVLTTGNPIGMLTIWYPAEPAIPPSPGFGGTSPPKPPKLAQTRNYELHFGDRIINTIPVLNTDKFDVQSGFAQHANPPK